MRFMGPPSLELVRRAGYTTYSTLSTIPCTRRRAHVRAELSAMEEIGEYCDLTPPETPLDATSITAEVKALLIDNDEEEGHKTSPSFVRRSSRKRSSTDFFSVSVSVRTPTLELEAASAHGKPGRKRKTQLSSDGGPTAKRSLVFQHLTQVKPLLPVPKDGGPADQPSDHHGNPADSTSLTVPAAPNPVVIEPSAPPQPSAPDNSSSAPDNSSSPAEDAASIDDFAVGTLVWGKLQGYDWWPGKVSCAEEVCLVSLPVGALWVRWYGEKLVSDVSQDSIEPWSNFEKRLNVSKMKGSYKKGVFLAIKEAARRSGKTFTAGSVVRRCKEGGPGPPNEESEVKQEDHECGDEIEAPPPRVLSPAQDALLKKLPTRGSSRLSPLEQDMLFWAMEGFLPLGPDGFKPSPRSLSTISAPEVPMTGWPDNKPTRRPAEGRSKSNIDTGLLLEAPPKRTPFQGPVALREMVTVPGGRIDTFDAVREGQLQLKSVCLGCGHTSVVVDHPLFEGRLCGQCRDSFTECVYLFDEDGTQMYCCICSAGQRVFMCDKPNCAKVYCAPCIRKLCGQEELDKVEAAEEWVCYMCSSEGFGLLKKQEDWSSKLHLLYSSGFQTDYPPPRSYAPIDPDQRQPLKVLALFDGIGTGMLVLKDLGLDVQLYVSSEVDPDAIKVSRVHHTEIQHVGDVEGITEKQVQEWGPFNLLIGGSPCNDLSIVNPARKGIYDGTGRLFFEFFRILSYCKPKEEDERPFFWLFENVVSMRAQDKTIISRFLQSNPVVVDAKDISAAHRARYFWGNLPGMVRSTIPMPGDRLTLQDCLEKNCSRSAQFDKLRTITTKMNSIKQTKKALMPIKTDNGEEDVLWCTEMERLFGFSDHYTDVANLGRHGRQKLLGRAWSVPVIRHLFSPLKEFFRSSTHNSLPSSRLSQSD